MFFDLLERFAAMKENAKNGMLICPQKHLFGCILHAVKESTNKSPESAQADSGLLVRVARLELAASWSQTRRPTNWATPGSHPSGMPRGQYQDIISDIYGKCKQNMLHISGGGELRQTFAQGGRSKTAGGAAHISQACSPTNRRWLDIPKNSGFSQI